MAESGKTREDFEQDIAWEKEKRKIILICAVIGFIVGTIIGVVKDEIIGGIWIGIGLGGAISLFPVFINTHKRAKKIVGENYASIINFILFVALLVIGPIGLLIRVLRINHRIKEFEECISEARQ